MNEQVIKADAAEYVPMSRRMRWIVRGMDLALGLAWTTLVAVVLVTAAPKNVFELTPSRRTAAVSLLPQGWGFFTRSPVEESIRAYRERGDGTFSSESQPDFRGFPFGGVSRLATIRGIELDGAAAQLLPESWAECRGSITECAPLAQKSTEVRLDMRVHTLCGEYLLLKSKPMPWAWASSKRPVRMRARVVRVRFVCRS
jgi:antimicrobial peptide system SdpA family protein